MIAGPTKEASILRAIDTLARESGGRLLSNLVGNIRDFQLAEDSLQDALESALIHWTRNGLPHSPQAWIMQTARRKAIDRLRRSANFRAKSDELTHLIEMENQSVEDESDDHIKDERLKLIFTCCHPALDRKTSVALTLRSVCGLKTEEIADAFLDGHDAMAQRLVRARHKISKAGIAYEVPGPSGWVERLESVLAVIYLIFNEGYASSGDVLIRADLCNEAIRLGRLLAELCPQEAEIEGLHALMLLHHARAETRIDKDGGLIPLESQDRSRWNHAMIAEGSALLEHALRRGRPGLYQLQAAIVAVHAEAPSYAQTDWTEILLIYDELVARSANPVLALNRLVALSYVSGPSAALQALAPLAVALSEYQPYHAVLADLLLRSNQPAAAGHAYRSALALSSTDAERRYMQAKLRALEEKSA